MRSALATADERQHLSAGYFLAQLPPSIHAHMWALLTAFMKSGAPAEIAPRWLTLLHSFTRHTPCVFRLDILPRFSTHVWFSRSRLDSLAALPSLLESAPPKSLREVLLYLSVLAPSEHLYSLHPVVLSEAVCALAKALNHPEILQVRYCVFVVEFVPIHHPFVSHFCNGYPRQECRNEEHRSELDSVMDVLWHWRAALKGQTDSIGVARVSLRAVHQPLREQLACW